MLGLEEVAGDEKRGGKGVGCGYTSMTFSVVFGTQHTRSTMPKLKSVELVDVYYIINLNDASINSINCNVQCK